MIKKIEQNQFDEVLEAPFAVVDFNATWCGPCRMVAPIIEELSAELGDKAAFFAVDVDENGAIAAQYQIASIPTIMLFKNGEPVDLSVGYTPKEELEAFIKAKM